MLTHVSGACLFRRRGQREVPVTVEVEPEGFPEFHTPAPKLAELLGLPAGAATTRDEVLHALWRYIRTHKLQARAWLSLSPCLPQQRMLMRRHAPAG